MLSVVRVYNTSSLNLTLSPSFLTLAPTSVLRRNIFPPVEHTTRPKNHPPPLLLFSSSALRVHFLRANSRHKVFVEYCWFSCASHSAARRAESERGANVGDAPPREKQTTLSTNREIYIFLTNPPQVNTRKIYTIMSHLNNAADPLVATLANIYISYIQISTTVGSNAWVLRVLLIVCLHKSVPSK